MTQYLPFLNVAAVAVKAPSDVIPAISGSWGNFPGNSNGDLYFGSYLRSSPYVENSQTRNPAADLDGGVIDGLSVSPTNKSLTGYRNQWFYASNRSGSDVVVFYAPVFGASTTPGTTSNDSRAEIRVILGSFSSGQNFKRDNIYTGHGVVSVEHIPSGHTSSKNSVFISQIHAASKAFMTLKLGADGVLSSTIRDASGATTGTLTLASGVNIGDLIDYSVTYGPTDALTWTVKINGTTVANAVPQATDAALATVEMYGKWGLYFALYNTDTNDYGLVSGYKLAPESVTDYGQLVYYSFTASLANP